MVEGIWRSWIIKDWWISTQGCIVFHNIMWWNRIFQWHQFCRREYAEKNKISFNRMFILILYEITEGNHNFKVMVVGFRLNLNKWHVNAGCQCYEPYHRRRKVPWFRPQPQDLIKLKLIRMQVTRIIGRQPVFFRTIELWSYKTLPDEV